MRPRNSNPGYIDTGKGICLQQGLNPLFFMSYLKQSELWICCAKESENAALYTNMSVRLLVQMFKGIDNHPFYQSICFIYDLSTSNHTPKGHFDSQKTSLLTLCGPFILFYFSISTFFFDVPSHFLNGYSELQPHYFLICRYWIQECVSCHETSVHFQQRISDQVL